MLSYAGFLTFVFFIMSSEYEGQVHGCEEEVTKIFARTGGVASFNFSVGDVMTIPGNDISFLLKNPSKNAIAQILYEKVSQQITNQTLSKVTLQQASWNGEIQINIHGIATGDKGLYILYCFQKSDLLCSFLYIFGKPQKPVVSHDNNSVLGRNSQLSCSSSSTTNPTNHTLSLNYSWVVNDTRNPANTRYKYGSSRKTLNIMPVAREDANKIFKCIATESGDGVTGLTSDNSDEFIFRVIYGPDTSTTTLTPAKTTYTLVENTRLDDIVCAADCYPECQYIWTKPGNSVVSNNGVLSLGTLKRNETSTYTCTVTRSQTTVSVTKQVYVFVIYGPDAGSVKLNPVKRTYTENEGTHLNDITCSTECYPTCSYKWTKSGTNAVVSNSAVLALATLNKDKAATYTCAATNPRKGGSAATDVVVHVRYGPDTCTINSSSPLTLSESGSSPTVSCESECYPSCSHTWSNVSSNSPIGENGKLQLVKMTRYQAGNYKCLCKNTAIAKYVKNQTATLHIIIQYPPDVNVSLSTENITEGNTLILSCDADGVPSVYNYKGFTQTWNGTSVPNTHGEMSGTPRYSTLSIPTLQLQDSGTYTCYVNNGVKTEDTVSSVNVKVKVLPKILTSRSQFAGKIDGTVNVSVRFYSYPDIEEVVFKQHDNKTLTNHTAKYIVSHFKTTVKDKFYGKDVSLSGMQANLVISNVKQEDFGSYTLILKNELGKTITPFTVDAESIAVVGTESSKDDNECTTLIIVSSTVGLICVVVIAYAAGITILYKRKGMKHPYKASAQTTYVNSAYLSDATKAQERGQRLEHVRNATGIDEDSYKQYTDLTQYSRDDRATYDVIQ